MLEREKKHSKGIIKKITTKLTKSASVDDPNISMDLSLQVSKQGHYLFKRDYYTNNFKIISFFVVADIGIRNKHQ